MNNIFIVIIAYSALVVAVSLATRKHKTVDEYLMGGRNASPAYVGSALFTLVGGGELITLTALAYTYGWAGLSLFLGYALGFAFLAIYAGRIRANDTGARALSLPDYAHQNFGPIAGHLVFLVSFAAFFSMLIIQFVAGGQILQQLLKIDYALCVLIVASVAAVYLVIGGFKTVLATDMIQGISRLLLMPLIIVAVAAGVKGGLHPFSAETLPIMVWVSLTITGFFAAASSADVWQRIYAARSDRAASGGLIIGAASMLMFGALLALLGILTKEGGITLSPDSAFVDAISSGLPAWAAYLTVILVLSTIMGTADTEIFLLAGILGRELLRIRGVRDVEAMAHRQSISKSRVLVIVIAGSAVVLSLIFRELVAIYTWLLSAILVISPMVLGSLFIKPKQWQVQWSMVLNLALFTILAVLGLLSPENAYLIVIPGFLLFGTLVLRSRKT
ncbi:MAG: hypothetical protein HY940_02260 [Gammaproteobacteria bacterium]|nr:hypothetical protein [Gammaproteobacteria bacterium]